MPSPWNPGRRLFLFWKGGVIWSLQKKRFRCIRDAALRCAPYPADAETMLDYLRVMAEETPFVLRSPGEDVPGLETEQEFIKMVLSLPNDLILVVEVDGEFAGNCHIEFYTK